MKRLFCKNARDASKSESAVAADVRRRRRSCDSRVRLLTSAATLAAGVCVAAELPAGSLVLRGPKRMGAANATVAAPGTNSPEHRFGLQIEEAMKTNGYSFIARAFDVDAFYRRFVPTLPASEETKERLFAAPRQNAALRNQILDGMVGDVTGLHIRFLGVRMLADDCALLF